MPERILLQTTLQHSADDWNIGSFSLLAEHLSSIRDENGHLMYEVVCRDREARIGEIDPVLSRLDDLDFGQLWLFALDSGDGLSSEDLDGITRFHRRGGGILSTRDHNDMGSSLCSLETLGKAHYFHSRQPDPDDSRNCRDDAYTLSIDWPNYHSGANGDYQKIEVVKHHELMLRPDGSLIEHFPSHPHEGAVGAAGENAMVIATGKSKVTERYFNLVVAFDRQETENGGTLGRSIAESSFHHLVDYNWDIEKGCPMFLEEPPGNGYKKDPAALNDIKYYAANVARWLGKN